MKGCPRKGTRMSREDPEHHVEVEDVSLAAAAAFAGSNFLDY